MKELVKKSNERIKEFFEVFENTTYDDRLYTFDKANYHASVSSLKSLRITNKIVEAYLEDSFRSNAECVMNIYGLFQALFVGIDSMYQLSIGITKRKWSVNINHNEYLREIKYIRNDVVGHPSHRTYQTNVIGYCDLNVDKTTKKDLVYDVYQIEGNSESMLSHNVDIYNTITNYYSEEHKLMNDIYMQLKMEESLDESNNTRLTKLVRMIREDYLSKRLDFMLIEEMKNVFVVHYSNKNGNYNRFIWRANLMIDLLKMETTIPFQREIIDVLIKDQINRLIKISIDLDLKKYKKEEKIDQIDFIIPNVIIKFGRLIRSNSDLKQYLEYIHDPKYPYFPMHLRKIREACTDRDLAKLMDWYEKLLNDETMIFTLGKLLKDSIKYVSKNKKYN